MAERTRSLAQLLGYPDDARLLIINADDFGMCHGENVATIDGLTSGAFSSSTIMVPCPWFDDAARFARQRPDADLGVHITHTSEWNSYKWGPVLGAGSVTSMVDPAGNLFPDVPEFYASARLDEVERETRAQIDKALAAGIDVTHLDSHMGTMQLAVAYHELYVRLAAEYRLPIRMANRRMLSRMGLDSAAALADQLGVLAPDHFWIGGPSQPQETADYWAALIRSLQPGVTEIYIHAAIDTPEMRAVTDSWAQRQADFDFFRSSAARALLTDLGIELIGYRVIRDRQRQLSTC